MQQIKKKRCLITCKERKVYIGNESFSLKFFIYLDSALSLHNSIFGF